MGKLKSLGEFNERHRQWWDEAGNMKPRPNGIACPKCGHELSDSAPHIVLTSNPPQKHIGCPECDFEGLRIV